MAKILVVSSSLTVLGTQLVADSFTGSLTDAIPGKISFYGTASNAQTASLVEGTSSFAISASHIDVAGYGITATWHDNLLQLTASLNKFTGSFTGSFYGLFEGTASHAMHASYASESIIASYAITTSLALSASYVETSSNANTASHVVGSSAYLSDRLEVTGSAFIGDHFTDTFEVRSTTAFINPFSTLAFNTNVSQSLEYSALFPNITGSLQGTSSWAVSASSAVSASYINITGSNIFHNWSGDLLQLTGSAPLPTLQEVTSIGNTTSASVIIQNTNGNSIATSSFSNGGFTMDGVSTNGVVYQAGLNKNNLGETSIKTSQKQGGVNFEASFSIYPSSIETIAYDNVANATSKVIVSTGSISITSSIVAINNISATGSLFGTSSWSISSSIALSSSYAISASYAISSSENNHSIYSDTASYVNPLNQVLIVTGSIEVLGPITASVFTTIYTTSSVSVITGSSQFGSDVALNTHQFTGSVKITGSINLTGSLSTKFYSKEWHVSVGSGDDTTGNGSILSPFRTITKAFASVGNTGELIIIHPGTYTESPTLTALNVTVAANAIQSGGIVYINGTVTIASNNAISSIRLNGLRIDTLAHTAASPLYLYNCQVVTAFNKTSPAYGEIIESESNGVNITGASIVTFSGGKQAGVTVNNVGAFVSVNDSLNCAVVSVLAGSFSATDATIYAATSQGNAIVSSANTNVILYGSQIVDTSGLPTKINIGGNLAYDDISFNITGSTLGTSLSALADFQLLRGNLIGTSSYASNAITSSHLKVTGSNVYVNWSGDLLQLTGSGESKVYISDTLPPSILSTGSLWFNSDNLGMYVNYNGTWVGTSAIGAVASASYATTASYVQLAYVSQSVTASYALTASTWLGYEPEYLSLGLSANQTVTPSAGPYDIIFGNIFYSSSNAATGISYNKATGQMTLRAGKVYRLAMGLQINNSFAGGQTTAGFYTTANALIGPTTNALPTTFAGSVVGVNVIEVIYPVGATDVVIKPRIASTNDGGGVIIGATGTWLTVNKL